MKPSTVVAAFAAAVLALVIGWFGGGLVRDAVTPSYDTAIGVVDAAAGVPVETASPTPSASVATSEPEPTQSAEPTDEPEPTKADSILCEGAKPDENCDCDLQDGEWVWVCEIPTTTEPTAVPAPTP